MSKWKKDNKPKIVKLHKKIKGNSDTFSKIVAEIDWGNGVNGIDIRTYSEKDKIPLKGITIPFEHCKEVGEILISNNIESDYDAEVEIKEEEPEKEAVEFDFDSMFNRVEEANKYSRDSNGLLIDDKGYVIIPRR